MANNDWLKLLSEANARKADKVPPGYKLKADWLKEFRISAATFERNIPVLVENGTFIVGYYRRINNAGALVKMKHFKKK